MVDLSVRLRGSGKGSGAHTATIQPDGPLVIEWYDFGDDAPYESANMLVFDCAQQEQLGAVLGLPVGERGGQGLLAEIQDRFETYFDAQSFARENGVQFSKSVDFMP